VYFYSGFLTAYGKVYDNNYTRCVRSMQ